VAFMQKDYERSRARMQDVRAMQVDDLLVKQQLEELEKALSQTG